MATAKKSIQRQRRKVRIRTKISGTAERPRLTVYRSLNKTTAQLIDDVKGVTLLAVNSKGRKIEDSLTLGKLIAEEAKRKKINECVFDRNGYMFHGRVKAVADGAREAGLKF